jgi:hypothetical protein
MFRADWGSGSHILWHEMGMPRDNKMIFFVSIPSGSTAWSWKRFLTKQAAVNFVWNRLDRSELVTA